MKVTVNKYLNARIGEASTNALCNTYKRPGDIIDINDVVIGTEIEGNSIWYHCGDDGCYYWSGGVAENGFGINVGVVKSMADFSQSEQLKFLNSAIPDILQKFGKENFKGVSVGVFGGRAFICFSVSEKVVLQKEISYKSVLINIRVEAPETFRANSVNIFKDIVKPFVMGGSLYNIPGREVGTRGLKLYLDGVPVILTCFHVACYNLMERRQNVYDGSDILIQIPAPAANSPLPAKIGNVTAGRLMDYYDYSLVSVIDNDVTDSIASIGFPSGYYDAFTIDSVTTGVSVKTFGCITGGSGGKVTKPSIPSSYVEIEYDFIGKIQVYGTIETEKICTNGDSGAPVVDKDNVIIGIVIASNNTRSLVMPFYRLLNIHKLKLNLND